MSWLVINSMRAEQMQWSMLCIQNVANIYRKNAFARILACAGTIGDKDGPAAAADAAAAAAEPGGRLVRAADAAVMALPLRRSLKLFDEHIDFSLEASVPDPIPFEAKLREMLTAHDEFILTPAQHEAGHSLMSEVAAFALVSESGNLDTEQEREQEQEQEKEVKSRRDQQVEVEKFVEREYRCRPLLVALRLCSTRPIPPAPHSHPISRALHSGPAFLVGGAVVALSGVAWGGGGSAVGTRSGRSRGP